MTQTSAEKAIWNRETMTHGEDIVVTSGKPRRRVAFVINSLAGGGAERVMCTLLRASEAERQSVDISLILLDRETAAYKVPAWVKVEQLNCRHSLLRSVWSLYRALRRSRPDATLSFLTRANVANVIAACLLKIPAVISERVNTTSHLGKGRSASLAKFLVKWLYPKARRIIAVSPGVADDLHTAFGVPQAKLVVISNPIDIDDIRARSQEAENVAPAEEFGMAMGRLVPNKNFRMLIDAFAAAKIGGKLLILGDGSERDALTAQIEQLGLTGRVVMPGFSANPFATLRKAAYFTLPSNAEGFPNSLLEAMSVGVPVISTNCQSGPSEVLADQAREDIVAGVVFAEHGILVPPNDATAMKDALRAMSEPERRAAYGLKAAARAAEFSVERAKLAYWQVILSECDQSEVGFAR
jgi:N-acetylgalactosamine-N,N'-diacetylbacillosaminyl-diphospho-undecaprenol 4-alpha-N-acetylgalactosaminyltransferase